MRKGIFFVVAFSIALALAMVGHVAGNTSTGSLSVTGVLTMGTGAAIRSGATDYSTGTGYFMDYNGGTPRFRIGDPAGSMLSWNGSLLAIQNAHLDVGNGEITAASGAVSIDGSGIELASGSSGSNNYKWDNGVLLSAGSGNLLLSTGATGGSITMATGGSKMLTFDGDMLWANNNSVALGGYSNRFSAAYVWGTTTTGALSVTSLGDAIVVRGAAGLNDNDLCGSNDGIFSLNVQSGIVVGATCVLSDRPTMQQQVDALREEILRLREELDTLRAERPQAARPEIVAPGAS